MEGIEWMWQLHYFDILSWTWFNPYQNSPGPYAKDFSDIEPSETELDDRGVPLAPKLHFLAVTPRPSWIYHTKSNKELLEELMEQDPGIMEKFYPSGLNGY